MAMLLACLLAFAGAVANQDFSTHTVATGDFRQLSIRHFAPLDSSAPTIIIVHDWALPCDQWTDIAERLQGLGFGVLLFNLRGHGGSSTAYYFMNNAQIAQMHFDVEAAVSFARSRGGARVFILGAGLGANLAINQAITDGTIAKVVAVSPGLNYRGNRIDQAPEELEPDRLMLIASLEDVYSVYTVRQLQRRYAEPPRVHLYNNAGHGVWILKRLGSSVDTIASWLRE